MQISKIYSNRKCNTEVYSDLIYEWEDDISKYVNIPIYSHSKLLENIIRTFFRITNKTKINYIIQKLDNLRNPKIKTLVFELYPRSNFSFQVFSNKIPYIIDFDFNVNLKVFNSVYKNCKLILISSLEAFNYLKNNNCQLNIAHLPLSISNRYNIDMNAVKYKEFDVIVARSNSVFTMYLERFSKEYPNFEYVVRRWEGNLLYKNNVYFSNKRGILGEFSDRTLYLELLKKAKVALYTTPGYDETQKRFMNHVTPSLFEFISSGCRIIARYPKNAETNFFQLEKLSPSVETYEHFKLTLCSYLEDKSFQYLKISQDFLQNLYTKNQVVNLNLILKNNL